MSPQTLLGMWSLIHAGIEVEVKKGLHCNLFEAVPLQNHGVTFDSLQWRQNERYGVSNNLPHEDLLKRLFRRT